MEHYKNFDLADINYFCDFDLVWKIEKWSDVRNYEGKYKVSDLGRVKSLARLTRNRHGNFMLAEKILKPKNDGHGYFNVGLSNKYIRKNRKIHQLVTESFLNHTPCGFKLVVNHKNFVRNDNRLSNLEIITSRENTHHTKSIRSSEFTGVSWWSKPKKWGASIWIDGKSIFLGNFKEEYDAHIAYETAFKLLKENKINEIKKPNFSSKYKGVSWAKNIKKWHSFIIVEGVKENLGYFINEIDAHNAYQNRLKELI